MKYNEEEKKFIRIIAQWFRGNKRFVNRDEAIKELGVDDSKYETLIGMMEHNGIVEILSSVSGEKGYAVAFRPSPYAEELAREFDEEDKTSQKNKPSGALNAELVTNQYGFSNQGRIPDWHTTKHKTLQGRFEKFLVEKGYDLTGIVYDAGPKHELPDMTLIEGKEFVLMIDLKTSDTLVSLKSAKLLLDTYQKKDRSIPAYIIVWSENSYGFEIYSASGKGKPTKISYDAFPKYEDLLNQRKGNDYGGIVSVVGVLREKFMAFLQEEKGCQNSSLHMDDSDIVAGDGRRCGLEIIGEGETLAVIEFGLSEDESVLQSAFNSFQAYVDDKNNASIMFYLVLPDVADLGEQFNIHEFDMATRETVGIFRKDFPFYEDFFNSTKGGNSKYVIALCKDKGADVNIDGLVEYLNRLCKHVLFIKDHAELVINDGPIYYPKTHKNVLKQLNEDIECDLRMVFTERRYSNDFFYLISDDVCIASFSGWASLTKLSKNNGATYFIACIIAIAINSDHRHDENVGCIYDFLTDKTGIDKGMKNGEVCSECLERIEQKLVGEKKLLFDDLTVILNSLQKASKKGIDVLGGMVGAVEDGGTVEGAKGPTPIVGVIGNVATIRIESIGEKDRLGRDALVKTLAGMFALTDCDNGFTMALLGDWGQGKSTVMGLLQTELEKKHKGKFEFATYNAWEYEKTENVSAGIAQEVVKGLIGKIGGWQKISLRRKFAWREYNEKLRGLLITTLLALNIAVILWDIALLFDDISSWCNAVAAVFGLSAIGLPVFSFKDLKKIFEHPLSTQLQTYLKLPDYGEHLGLIPVLKRHIKILCDFQLDKKKLVVFVDDLDRCNVDHIAKVLDAIRLVMTIPNVIVMIGIDHRIAFKAIQKHYKELADGDDRRGVAEIARDYLGKIIQLPLQLRAASHEELEEYVFEKLFDKKNIVDDTKLKEKAEVGLTEHGKQKAEVKLKLDIKTVREAVLNNRGGHEQTSDQGVMTIWNSLGKETKRKYLESINGGNSVAAEVEVTEKDMKEAIKDKKSEQKAFYELAGTFEFSNPRQLLRLHNSFRFLKGFGRGTGKGYETLDMLKMLFWQEFLHNWPKNVRGACMAELMGKKHSVQLEPKVRSVLDNVKGDDVQLFNEPESYEQMAKFVRMVVLPHNEEGVLDKQTDIDAWIKKADEEERRLARIRAKEEGQGSA